MWNKPISGTSIIPSQRPTVPGILNSGVLERLFLNRLPSTWTVEVQVAHHPAAPDALLQIRTPAGDTTRMLVEIKSDVPPARVPLIANQLEQFGSEPKLLVAPFLSPRTQQALTDLGISYADLTGNIRLQVDTPALFIRDQGLTSDPWRQERSIQSLKGPTAGRVVRALCDFQPPYGVRDLSERSRTAVSSVSRVMSFLEPEGLITRELRGTVTAVLWPDLIRRWTQDYSFIKSNTIHTFLEPRGLRALYDKLAGQSASGHKYAITGSLAANEVAAFAPARLATLYAENPEGLAADLGLRLVDSGANVLIAEPFDPVVFDRTWNRNDVVYAALSQVAADLLTGPGRTPAEGEELLTWMRENPNEWRT